MTDAPTHRLPLPPYRRSRQLLRDIADVLGRDIEAFQAPPSHRLIHTASDGTQWFVVVGTEKGVIVREVAADLRHPAVPDQPIAAFLAYRLDTPQGNALAAFIDGLVTDHIRT